MKFCWSTIYVKNMEESLKFYEEILGLSVNKKFEAGPGIVIAFLGEGETQIELICDNNHKNVEHSQDISLGFEVSSIEERLTLVKAKGIAIHSGPFQPNPHLQFLNILDPNGLKIQLVENL